MPTDWRQSRLAIAFASWLRDQEFSRFIVVGGVNTLVTYLIYVGLLPFLAYSIAYSVTYFLGIVLSYYLNSRFVFKERLRLVVAFQYPVVYLVQYLAGLALLYLLVELAHFSKFVAPILIVAVTVPITYAVSRFVIRRGAVRSHTRTPSGR